MLQHFAVTEPLDLSIMADLPARSGLGSSSSFTVGLINLVHCVQKRPITKLDLARTAVFVERDCWPRMSACRTSIMPPSAD